MIVSVASGKGGTGKTTVSASLASVWDGPLAAVDLDVEEPNLHLFLRPEVMETRTVSMEIPVLDEERCTRCRACVDLCQFKAITILGDTPMVFAEMCHGCGGCFAVCPEGALSRGGRELGTVEYGRANGQAFLMGRLRVGEAMSPPLMREVKALLDTVLKASQGDAVIDSPPGVSCPAVNAVMDSDYIVLVTEPTPFGLHDFALAVEAFAPLGKPMGAIVNRAGIGDDSVQRFCADEGIPVLAEIPFDRAIAEAYSRGGVVAEVSPRLEELFGGVRDRIRATLEQREVRHA